MTWLKQGEAEVRAEVSLARNFAFFTLYEGDWRRESPEKSPLLTLLNGVKLREYEIHSRVCRFF